MGAHEKDKGRDGDGRWPNPLGPQTKPDPGRHERREPERREDTDPGKNDKE